MFVVYMNNLPIECRREFALMESKFRWKIKRTRETIFENCHLKSYGQHSM